MYLSTIIHYAGIYLYTYNSVMGCYILNMRIMFISSYVGKIVPLPAFLRWDQAVKYCHGSRFTWRCFYQCGFNVFKWETW